jgi:hypothetical protein
MKGMPGSGWIGSFARALVLAGFLGSASEVRATVGSRDTVLVNAPDSSALPEEPTPEPQRHSPGKAAWRAAALPGWGQIYNRKYWKLPLVYGGLGGLGYWVYFNADQHRFYRQAFLAKTDEDPATADPLPAFSEASVLQTKEYYRRQLDASVLLTTAFYGLQIVDAVVDAHLFHFDVSPDLSLQWSPWTAPAGQAFGAAPLPRAKGSAIPAQGLHFILSYR